MDLRTYVKTVEPDQQPRLRRRVWFGSDFFYTYLINGTYIYCAVNNLITYRWFQHHIGADLGLHYGLCLKVPFRVTLAKFPIKLTQFAWNKKWAPYDIAKFFVCNVFVICLFWVLRCAVSILFIFLFGFHRSYQFLKHSRWPTITFLNMLFFLKRAFINSLHDIVHTI